MKADESKALAVVQFSVPDIRLMAEAVARSGLFGMKTPDQAMALMLIAHAEGLHPAIAARDYHIIQGRPSKTAEAMQRAFQNAGGKIEWHELTDERASATFSHPQGGSVTIDWDMKRAKAAQLEGKDNWKKWPRQMLRARVISEGTRTVYPGATSGMYTPEEVRDFEPKAVSDDPQKSNGNGSHVEAVVCITKEQQHELWTAALKRAEETGATKEQIFRDILVALRLKTSAEIPAVQFEDVASLIESWEPAMDDAKAE